MNMTNMMKENYLKKSIIDVELLMVIAVVFSVRQNIVAEIDEVENKWLTLSFDKKKLDEQQNLIAIITSK